MPGRCAHLVAVCLAMTAAWSGLACADRASAAPPNVVVILADDLGFSDLGCYGGEIDTPHIDRLAAGGLRFTQGYNTARCWPTRAALLTGYYAQAVHRDALPDGTGGTGGRRPAWARLLPELLAPAGYRSYHSGKWHIDGDPRQQGFVRSLQVEGGQNDYFDTEGITVDGRPIPTRPDFYTTTAVGEHAVECLKDHAAAHPGGPFFHYVAFTAPHFPLHAPQDLIGKYRDRYRAGWNEVQAARRRRVAEMGIVTTPPAEMERGVGSSHPSRNALEVLGPGELDRPLPWVELSPEQQDFQITKMAIHAAMVDAMDQAVGKIVAQLEAMNALDDTLILFLSDNGATAEMLVRGKGHDRSLPPGSSGTYLCLGPSWSSCANTPFRRHKRWVHEGGIATPWIVHWPKGVAAKGELRPQPVHVIDVVPTVLELAGVVPPREQAGAAVPPMQGRSFGKALAAGSAPPAQDTLWWCHEGNRAVRVGDWKLVATKDAPWELYDLAKDRCETRDRAATHPDKVAELEAAWNRIAAECRALGGSADKSKASPATSTTPKRPNIIYVMTDDQGYGDIASHGNPILKTPHLDRLREQSVRLTEFHASPTCAPTRAALFTGRHEFRSGVTHTIHERERLALSAVTLPQLLRRAGGYTTGIFGKWHLGDEDEYQPGQRGFDRVFIHGGGGIGQSYPGSCGDAPGNTYHDPVIRSDGTFVKTNGYCTDVFFDEALTWMDAKRKQGKPFFCSITPNAPHSPYDPPSGADAPYLATLEAAGIPDQGRPSRAEVASFFGMIENIDANMGRLMAKLDEWGIADDTLLVFTTDNGTAAGGRVFNAGMRAQKGSPYRGGTRVPAFWRWPGRLPAGVDVPAITAHIDVLPTLCELADVTIPPAVAAKIEGRSFVPLLCDASAAWPDRPLITHVGRWDRGKAAESAYANCRLREGKWSLVNTKNSPGAWELYDVAADPGEQTNLAAAQPEVVKRLAATYDAWWASVQPDLVNENLDGPAVNPFKAAYERQFIPPASKVRRPNILYIIVDDQSPFDFKFYNPASTLRAPVIERLAAEGMVFDAAYHMGSFSGAVCTPSRHMVMCGRSVWRLPIGQHAPNPKQGPPPVAVAAARCPPDIAQFTMAPIFNAAGYDTMRTCKEGNAYEAADALFTVRHDATKRGGTAESGSVWHGDRVMDYLTEREFTKDTDPFLIYFGFSHPHDTRDGTPELLATYGATNHTDEASRPPADSKQPPLPANWLPGHPFDHGHMGVRDEVAVSGVWDRRDEATIRNELGREYACSENIDRQIGRVLDKLAAMGELENTWIFYTADHGMAIGRHGLQGKQNLYEHTWRVPFVVNGPGVKPGSRAAGNIYLGDSLATLCDIAGIPAPETNEGTSFLPVLEGRQETVRDVLYGAYCGGQKPGMRSVRRGDWKLIKYESRSGGMHTQLFNLRENPHEFLAEHHAAAVTSLSHAAPTANQKNLADDPAFAATRADMEALLLAEMRRHDDPFRFSDQPPP